MIIEEQCREGGKNNYNYLPHCAWGDDVRVQWGYCGVSINRKEQTVTPVKSFFEAFPPAPNNTFLRGEGDSVHDAEDRAFTQYEKMMACPQHEWDRRGRTDGYAYCKLCGMSQMALEPLTRCAICDIPSSWTSRKENGEKKHYCRFHDPQLYKLTDEEVGHIRQYLMKRQYITTHADNVCGYRIVGIMIDRTAETHYTDGLIHCDLEQYELWYKDRCLAFIAQRKYKHEDMIKTLFGSDDE